jgi:sugar/nucleoside kinase (ribokinase family)
MNDSDDYGHLHCCSLKGLTHGLGVDVSLDDLILHDVPVQSPLYRHVTGSKDAGGLGLSPGAKAAVSHEAFLRCLEWIEAEGRTPEHSPGGSTGNTVYNIGRLLRQHGLPFHFTLYTALNPDAEETRHIQAQYREAGIVLPNIPREIMKHADIARSVIINAVDEQQQALNRIIVTWKGNADKILTPDLVTDTDLAGAQYFFIQGAGWKKFASAQYAYGSPLMDKIINARWSQNKPLIFALPTDADFAREHGEAFRSLFGCADYVLSNIEELVSVFYDWLMPLHRHYISGYPYFASIEATESQKLRWRNAIEMDALNELRVYLHYARGRVFETQGRELYPVGYVTRGHNGAALVYPDSSRDILHIPPQPIKSIRPSFAGAGDAAYSGFLLGLLTGCSPALSAHYGVMMSAAKINHAPGTRITSPATQLHEHEFYAQLVGKASHTAWQEP